jgi:hypothetical protein
MNEQEARAYMRTRIRDNTDPLTDEVNMTGLAEDACDHFGAWEGDDVPERFFEWAYAVACL